MLHIRDTFLDKQKKLLLEVENKGNLSFLSLFVNHFQYTCTYAEAIWIETRI